MPYGPVVISQKAVRWLVATQSILSGLQIVAAAAILGEVIGNKWAALFIVIIAGAQQAVNNFISKSVGEAVTHVENVVQRAEDVTAAASDTVNALAAQLPPEQAISFIEERKAHHG